MEGEQKRAWDVLATAEAVAPSAALVYAAAYAQALARDDEFEDVSAEDAEADRIRMTKIGLRAAQVAAVVMRAFEGALCEALDAAVLVEEAGGGIADVPFAMRTILRYHVGASEGVALLDDTMSPEDGIEGGCAGCDRCTCGDKTVH